MVKVPFVVSNSTSFRPRRVLTFYVLDPRPSPPFRFCYVGQPRLKIRLHPQSQDSYSVGMCTQSWVTFPLVTSDSTTVDRKTGLPVVGGLPYSHVEIRTLSTLREVVFFGSDKES